MILITSFALSKNDARNAELAFALRKNVDNRLISQIYIITEDVRVSELTRDMQKISVSKADDRVTFKVLVDFANTLNDTVIVANSDIIFDDSLRTPPPGVVFCLTRWIPDICANGNVHLVRVWEESAGMSFDSYIFKPPITIDSLDFPIGILGCDGKFAYELHRAGLHVVNPSRTIRSGHVHGSGHRTYGYGDNDWIKGSYLRIGITSSLEYNPNLIAVHRTVV